MGEVERRIISTDEDGNAIYLNTPNQWYGGGQPSAQAKFLEDHGLDVPGELVAEFDRISAEWDANQSAIIEWFDSLFAEGERDRFASVVLDHDRTWTQYRALPTCNHAEAIAKLREHGDRSATCKLCGSYVAWEHKRNPETNGYDRTGEILVHTDG